MIDLKSFLPFWFAGPEVSRLAKTAQAFWQRLEDALWNALRQGNIAQCSLAALELHAWERGVSRLPGEPEALWRQRVQHALTTSIESGSRAGLEKILTTYGVKNFSVLERQPDNDWDVIEITLDPDALSADTALLDRIFAEWGRVCRRHVITHTLPSPVYPISLMTDEQQRVETAL